MISNCSSRTSRCLLVLQMENVAFGERRERSVRARVPPQLGALVVKYAPIIVLGILALGKPPL